MKVRGEIAPVTAFTLEPIPKKPGKALIRFNENAKQYTKTENDATVRGWEWDEYHLELADYPGLEADVTVNHSALLQQAKKMEEDANRLETLTKENRLLKAQVEAQSATLDFYEDCIVEMAGIVYA